MPTNGFSEWVFPALNSIYDSNVSLDLFEVIVTDNGSNSEFEDEMTAFSDKYENLIYKKTDAYMFDNQLEALKLAKGDYLKFVNHRSVWLPDRLQYMIDFLDEYKDEKPVIYFSNGAMGWGPMYKEFGSFDQFVLNLGIQGTWTSGVGIWKSQYDMIKDNYQYDRISPHAGILYSDRKNKKYIINDKYWMRNIDDDHSKKGKYNLFKAFALDEFIITINLYRDGDITEDTLIKVKEDFKQFLMELYRDFYIKKLPCSYDLSGFHKYINIFFDEKEIIEGAQTYDSL
jgi:hypothetical protein